MQDSVWAQLRLKKTPRALKAAENIPSSHVQPSLLPKYSLSKTKKTSKTRWWKNYMAKPQHIQKIPQSPADTLLPCIIDQWQFSSPMDSTWNYTMKLDWYLSMGWKMGCQMQFSCVIPNDSISSKWINSNQTSNRAPVTNLFPLSFWATA